MISGEILSVYLEADGLREAEEEAGRVSLWMQQSADCREHPAHRAQSEQRGGGGREGGMEGGRGHGGQLWGGTEAARAGGNVHFSHRGPHMRFLVSFEFRGAGWRPEATWERRNGGASVD